MYICKATERHSKIDIMPAHTYCHRICHTAEEYFAKRSDEVVEKQDVWFAKNSESTEATGVGPPGQNNTMYCD